jgi:hypothetical protein
LTGLTVAKGNVSPLFALDFFSREAASEQSPPVETVGSKPQT